MKRIPLFLGGRVQKYALIDDEDYELVSRLKWRAYKNYNTWYASARKVRFYLAMHQLILPGLKQIDHRNHNGLDNQKRNLRACNDHQNQGNQVLQKNKSSRFKGVSWNRKSQRWEARIWDDGKNKSLGLFADETYAAIVYDTTAKKVFGEFACTNHDLGLI